MSSRARACNHESYFSPDVFLTGPRDSVASCPSPHLYQYRMALRRRRRGAEAFAVPKNIRYLRSTRQEKMMRRLPLKFAPLALAAALWLTPAVSFAAARVPQVAQPAQSYV